MQILFEPSFFWPSSIFFIPHPRGKDRMFLNTRKLSSCLMKVSRQALSKIWLVFEFSVLQAFLKQVLMSDRHVNSIFFFFMYKILVGMQLRRSDPLSFDFTLQEKWILPMGVYGRGGSGSSRSKPLTPKPAWVLPGLRRNVGGVGVGMGIINLITVHYKTEFNYRLFRHFM